MATESDLMIHYTDSLLHGGDFGELDKELLTEDFFEGITVPDFDFGESGDFIKSSIHDRAPYEDRVLWNGDAQKQEIVLPVESDENMETAQKLHSLSLDSMDKATVFLQFPEAKTEPESSILIGYPTSNGMSSSYTSVTYSAPTVVSPTTQLAVAFNQASLLSPQISLSNGSTEVLASSTTEELLLEKNKDLASTVQFSTVPRTGSSIDLGNFVSKADTAEDSLSPLPTYTHRPSMMQRSFSSHSLDQLRTNPRINEASFHPQFSPVYTSVTELPSTAHRLQPQLSDLQGMNIRPASRSMRRVFSTGDIQTSNGMQLNHGSGSPLTSETSSFEEAGFKIGRYSAEERKQRIHRYRKKRSERNFNKKIKYACRKTLADSRPRVRGRFARNEDAGDIPSKLHHDEDDEDEVDAVQEDDEDFLIGNGHTTFSNGMIRMTHLNGTNGYPFGF